MTHRRVNALGHYRFRIDPGKSARASQAREFWVTRWLGWFARRLIWGYLGGFLLLLKGGEDFVDVGKLTGELAVGVDFAAIVVDFGN